MKEALKELFSLQTLQGAQAPEFGINAEWQRGPVLQGRTTLFNTFIQPGHKKTSQLFGAGAVFELFLYNIEPSGVLATNLDHRRHTESTSNNQSSSAALKALLGYLKYTEVSSWG